MNMYIESEFTSFCLKMASALIYVHSLVALDSVVRLCRAEGRGKTVVEGNRRDASPLRVTDGNGVRRRRMKMRIMSIYQRHGSALMHRLMHPVTLRTQSLKRL